MPGQPPTLRRILISALAALTLALGAASLIAGFSDSFPVRLLQGLAVFGAGAVIIGGAVVLTMIRLAGWREPESELDFEEIVQRAERIAAGDATFTFNGEPRRSSSSSSFSTSVGSPTTTAMCTFSRFSGRN